MRKPRNLFASLIVFWTVLVIASWFLSSSTSMSFGQLTAAATMLTSAGIFLIQYFNTSNTQQPRVEETTPNEKQSNDSEETSTDKPETSATPGLDVTERRVQNAFIKKAYQRFYDNPIAFSASNHSHIFIQEIAEEEDVDEETVEKVWHMSKDDGFFKRRSGGNAWFFSSKGIRRAEALGEDILMDEALQDEILDVLLQSYREEPRFPRVEREELISAIGKPGKVVDHNVWWLREKRYVELHSGIGAEAGYLSIEITELGRKIAQ